MYTKGYAPDQTRQDATSPDDYCLPIDEALRRYEHAGHPRAVRSIQRYCARGDLECLRQEIAFGQRFMITPASVALHIAQIDEVTRATRRAPAAPPPAAGVPKTGPPRNGATGFGRRPAG